MKIKLIFFFMSMMRLSNVSAQGVESCLYQTMIENIMSIWTKIDTVRAINIDLTQKTIFLNDLVIDSLEVYHLAKQIKQLSVIPNMENDVSMIQTIKESFEEVFSSVKSDGVCFVCCILERIVHILKAPKNIESEIATEYIC